jgi:glycosyltransferase involved in cell wall biosynthesis
MVRNDCPDISFVMPCYNERASIGYTIPRLISAFERAGYKLELVAVDNGSTDGTADVLRALAAQWRSLVCHGVEKNEGYGNGVLSGIPLCTAPWTGIVPADGQVDAEDVVRLYEALATANGPLLGKVRRRFRMDGFRRKVVSITYNAFIRLLWPRLGSIDVNGTPKILARDVLLTMNLKSKDWFLDPEIMIKAHALGVRTLELNVFARMRGSGVSHVRSSTCWEFFRNLLLYRFTSRWKTEMTQLAASRQEQKWIPTIAARR